MIENSRDLWASHGAAKVLVVFLAGLVLASCASIKRCPCESFGAMPHGTSEILLPSPATLPPAPFAAVGLGANNNLVPALAEVRLAYFAALSDEEAAESLWERLKALPKPSALMIGYRGATEAVLAKHAWSPYTKLQYLSKAEATLAQAIATAPADLEIRFLRFSYEHYVPGFLGRQQHLDDDRKVLVRLIAARRWGGAPADLVRNAADFLLQTKRCTPAEAARLQAVRW